ncbi:MAG: hypothetical protein AAGA70_17860 [Pseudomonadota bacterium]
MPLWLYILAAVLGSLAGAVLDFALYSDGGSMFLKIGFVAGPVLVWLIGKAQAGRIEKEDGS